MENLPSRQILKDKVFETKRLIKEKEEAAEYQVIFDYFSLRIDEDFVKATQEVLDGKSIQLKWTHNRSFSAILLSEDSIKRLEKELSAKVPAFDLSFGRTSTAYNLLISWA